MQIPQSVKIGKRKYHITKTALRGATRGRVYPQSAFIELGSDDPYVFWHEVTHAILHDMGEDWRDEKFVIAFSKRLNQAIQTAKFNGKT
jgi:hypothetical protein